MVHLSWRILATPAAPPPCARNLRSSLAVAMRSCSSVCGGERGEVLTWIDASCVDKFGLWWPTEPQLTWYLAAISGDAAASAIAGDGE